MARLNSERIEQNCFHKIRQLVENEKDPSIKMNLENVGREICKSISIQQAEDTNIIARVLKKATESINQ